MLRFPIAAAMLFIAILPATQSFAVTAKEKMATCKFGADDQKLQGKARSAFIKRCMANRDDPRGPPAVRNPPPAREAMPPPQH